MAFFSKGKLQILFYVSPSQVLAFTAHNPGPGSSKQVTGITERLARFCPS